MKSKFITVTKGKTYGMVHGGSMIKKPAIKKMNTPPANTRKAVSTKKLMSKKGAYGGKVKKLQSYGHGTKTKAYGGKVKKIMSYGKGSKSGGCGCGGYMQQGGVIADTGTDIDPTSFSAVQSSQFPGGVPAALGAAGGATSNQPTIPSSVKENENTVIGSVDNKATTAGGIADFLKRLKFRRQAAGMITGGKSVPMTVRNMNQYGGGKTAGNKVQLDSVGGRMYKNGGSTAG